MTLQTILTALCMWCAAPASAATINHDSQECFSSKHEIRRVHKSEHVYKHITPNGMCYHIGPRNHSGAFAMAKPSLSQVGSNYTRPTKEVKTAHDVWKDKKPLSVEEVVPHKLENPYFYEFREYEYDRDQYFKHLKDLKNGEK